MANAERKSPPPSKRRSKRFVVEPVGADLVALAQAHALDVTVFPHQSVPPIFGCEGPPSLWVARLERGGPVLGFIAARADGGCLDIAGLAVEAAHRRAGIARALVRAVVRSARARDLDTIELHVSTGNDAAVALYTNERFRKTACVEGFYSSGRFPDGGDAWVMVRELF